MNQSKSFYKLKLAYNGSYYKGWQSQVDSGPTIQDNLNLALKKIFKVDEVSSLAAGRTDAGVSAKEQIVKITVPFAIEPNGLLKGLNTHLPNDIRVMQIEHCDDSFHPIRDAKSRVYRYYFTNLEIHNPLMVGLVYNYPYQLDINNMQLACKLFEGEHDFQDFHCKGSEPQGTIRKILRCEINKGPSDHPFLDDYYFLEIEGTGFLKQMVRCVMGSLLEVGRGKIQANDISLRLKNPQNHNLSFVAPASGLVKHSVQY